MKTDIKKRFTKTEWSWILYDWANSAWSTNISAAIWPVYFSVVVSRLSNAGEVNTYYGYAVSAASLVVAALAPFLGAIGDFRGMKKRLWRDFMLLGVISTMCMAVFGSWELLLLSYVISHIGFAGSALFYDSFLTDVTERERMDEVSSWGYAMGYIGGSTIPFVISIVIMILMDMSDLSYRIGIAIVPVWWFVFSVPMWRNVEQVYYVDTAPSELGRAALGNLGHTLRDICGNRAVLYFLLAYFFYIDGVDTIISMATNYGATLGLGSIGMILALMVTQLVAMPMTIVFGKLGRRFGGLRMIAIAVSTYALITVVGFLMGFIVDYNEMLGIAYERAISAGTVLFWVLAVMVGMVQGGIQALSRSYFGRLIPAERSSEYYGVMDIFGKFACVMGPALYAFVYGLSGKPCLGILSLILLFIAGGVFLFAGRRYFAGAESARIDEG